MALLEEHRNTLYNYFVPEIGKEATQAMLSQFPARDVEEPVTKEYLDLRLAEERLWVADQLQALRDGIDDRFGDRFNRIDDRFDRIDDRFDKIDDRFDKIGAKFDRIGDRFDRIDAKFDRLWAGMLTVAGLGLVVIGLMMQVFT